MEARCYMKAPALAGKDGIRRDNVEMEEGIVQVVHYQIHGKGAPKCLHNQPCPVSPCRN